MDVEQSRRIGASADSVAFRTFLICDIRGFSSFTSQRGDVAAARLAMRLADLARDAIVARGGRVMGFLGDGVIAVFGSASQGVRAGLEIQWACSEETTAHPDFPLPVGVGIDCGEAVPVEDDFLGAVVNKAARLCSQAVAGQILVTQSVVDSALGADDLAFEWRAAAELKGFDKPVDLFEARSPRAHAFAVRDVAAAPAPLPFALDDQSPLAGREHQLSWLRGTWRQARRGHGRVLLVSGPAGIGKTRLAAEFAGVVRMTGAVQYSGTGGSAGADNLAAIADAKSASAPALWVLDELSLHPESIRALSESIGEIESRPALVVGLFREIGGDPALERLVERVDAHGDGHRRLGPLDLAGVKVVAGTYVDDISQVPAESMLHASGGVPSRLHEALSQWARAEAQRRLEAAAEWLAAGKSKHSASIRFADNVIALKLGQIYEKRGSQTRLDTCPYKGLATFETSDAEYFFGRERLVGELAARMVGAGFMGVVGPSGTGKSSLVLAGLVPSLAAGLLPGSERWRHAVIRPGEHPVAALEAALLSAPATDRFVLVVDQFEEIFTTTEDESERADFLARIVSLAKDSRFVVVATIRADYTGHFTDYPELGELLTSNIVLVGPMTADELRRAIGSPARRVGLRVESALVEALVAEVRAEPGGLPLLSTALVELWQERDDGWLRFETYEQSDGVRGAVARLAESSYEKLSVVERDSAKFILLRLVGQGEADVPVRRRVAASEFDVDGDPAATSALSRLTEDRLLTRDDGFVEIAHEALIREWPRLSVWLEEDASGRQLRSHVTQAAKQWDERGRDPGDLYRGARLTAALAWLREHENAPNVLERDFLDQSRRENEHELDRQRRTNRRLRGLLAGTALLLALAVIAGLVALVARNDARTQQALAEAQRGTAANKAHQSQSIAIAVEASKLFGIDTPAGILLSLEAEQRFQTPEARSTLAQAAYEGLSSIWPMSPAGCTETCSTVTGVAFAPDGSVAATTDVGGLVQLWNPANGVIVKRWKNGKPGTRAAYVNALAFSPGSTMLATGDATGHVVLWHLPDGSRTVLTARGHTDHNTDQVESVAFSPNGALLATGNCDGEVVLWNLRAGGKELRSWNKVRSRVTRTLGGCGYNQRAPTGHVNATVPDLAFSPSGSILAVADAGGGAVSIWNVATGAKMATWTDSSTVWSLAFSRGGKRLFAGDNAGQLVAWDVKSGHRRVWSPTLSTPITDIVVSPDGATLAVGDLGGQVSLWNIATRSMTSVRNDGSPAWALAFSPNHDILASADNSGIVLWNTTSVDDQGDALAVGFSPDGGMIAVGHFSGVTSVWNTAGDESVASWNEPSRIVAVAAGWGGETVTTVDLRGQVFWWNVKTKRVTSFINLVDFPTTLSALAFSPDHSLLAGVDGSNGGRILVWNLADGTVREWPRPGLGPGFAIAFSPDGETLAAGEFDGVAIWNLANNDETRKHFHTVTQVAFSPDGKTLAVGTQNGQVALWNADGPTRGWTDGNPISGLSFAPDGRTLAVSDVNGQVTMWDTVLGTTTTIDDGDPVPTLVTFSPTGDSIVIDAVREVTLEPIWIWQADVGTLGQQLCSGLNGFTLTSAQWRADLPSGEPHGHPCP